MPLAEIENLAKIISLLIAIPAFALALLKFVRDRWLETNKPFLERQLSLYAEATRVASILATSRDPILREPAHTRFAELFWGELAMVEDHEVELAMIAFRKKLERDEGEEGLPVLSVRLAHACRRSLARSWNAPKWRSDY